MYPVSRSVFEAFAAQIVDQGELAWPGGADVDVVAFGILRGAPIELIENLTDGKANVVLAVAQLHERFAVFGFLRGNPDTQLVAVWRPLLEVGVERP